MSYRLAPTIVAWRASVVRADAEAGARCRSADEGDVNSIAADVDGVDRFQEISGHLVALGRFQRVVGVVDRNRQAIWLPLGIEADSTWAVQSSHRPIDGHSQPFDVGHFDAKTKGEASGRNPADMAEGRRSRE